MGQTAHNFRPTRESELRNGRGVIVITGWRPPRRIPQWRASERTTRTLISPSDITMDTEPTDNVTSLHEWMDGWMSQSPSPPTYIHTCGLSGLPQRASYARMQTAGRDPHLSRSTSLPSRPPLTLTSQVRRPHTQTTSAAAKPSEGLATRANRVSPWAPPGHTPSARRMRRRVRNTQHVFGGASTASLVYQVNSLCEKDNCWH